MFALAFAFANTYTVPGKQAGKGASFRAGRFAEIGQMFTWYWVQTFYEGMRAAGENTSIMLPRAGYVSSLSFHSFLQCRL